MKRMITLVVMMVMVLATNIEAKASWTEESKETIINDWGFNMAMLEAGIDEINGIDYKIIFDDNNDTYLMNYVYHTDEGNGIGMMIVDHKTGIKVRGKEFYKNERFDTTWFTPTVSGYLK